MVNPSEFAGLTEAQAEVRRKQEARRRYIVEQVRVCKRDQADVARELGTSKQAVNQWLAQADRAAEREGTNPAERG